MIQDNADYPQCISDYDIWFRNYKDANIMLKIRLKKKMEEAKERYDKRYM